MKQNKQIMSTNDNCQNCDTMESSDTIVSELVRRHKLVPRIFGGHFGLHYASPEKYTNRILFGDDKERHQVGSLYSLIRGNDVQCFHKFPVDCVVTFIRGHSLTVYVIDEDTKTMTCTELDADNFTITIPRGKWYGAKLNNALPHCYSFATVANIPGIVNEDAIFGKREDLIFLLPDKKDIITALTHY